MSKPMIECISLNKQYKGKRQTIDAVKDVSLTIEKGELVLTVSEDLDCSGLPLSVCFSARKRVWYTSTAG